MNAADNRPVCRYDGKCYRKNADHFLAYAHPKQKPDRASSVALADVITNATLPTPSSTPTAAPAAHLTTVITTPRASEGTEASHSVHALVDHPDRASPVAETTTAASTVPPSPPAPSSPPKASSPVSQPAESELSRGQSETSTVITTTTEELESGMPSLPLLQHLMNPHCLPGPEHTGVHHPVKETPACAVADLYPAFAHVDAYLHALYDSALGFHADDMRTVLLAAVSLDATTPLTAFPGWRLVGPYEAAYRAYQHAHAQHQRRASASAPSTAMPLFDPFRDEAARWRCARYRHDPPECQTIAVAVTGAATHTTLVDPTQMRVPPVHLCFHRDDPSACPSMVVKSGVSSPMPTSSDTTSLPREAYTWTVVSASLTAYLLACAREQQDARTVAALISAMCQVSASTASPVAAEKKSEALPDPDRIGSRAEQQRTMTNRRKRTQLAATVHELGVMAPYDAKTELGYRPLVMNRGHLKKLLMDWDGYFLLWRTQLEAAGAVTATGSTPRKAPRLEGMTTASKCAATTTDTMLASACGKQAEQGEKVFTFTPWSELQEQFRYADMANDEGDYGLNMELGMDIFSLVHTPSFSHPPSEALLATVETAQSEKKAGAAPITEEMKRGLNPLLWHTFRILDCVYMLLNRDVYRHVLRCHVPVLAGVSPLLRGSPMEIAVGAHLWASP